MPAGRDEILDAALQLSEDDRMFVVDRLLETLPEEPPGLSMDDPDFEAELLRRSGDWEGAAPLGDPMPFHYEIVGINQGLDEAITSASGSYETISAQIDELKARGIAVLRNSPADPAGTLAFCRGAEQRRLTAALRRNALSIENCQQMFDAVLELGFTEEWMRFGMYIIYMESTKTAGFPEVARARAKELRATIERKTQELGELAERLPHRLAELGLAED